MNWPQLKHTTSECPLSWHSNVAYGSKQTYRGLRERGLANAAFPLAHLSVPALPHALGQPGNLAGLL